MKPIELRWILAVLVFAPGVGRRMSAARRAVGLHGSDPPPQAALAQNPMYVPLSDREFLWNQLVDTVDDYFDIEREERVRLVGGVLTEGQLDTFPQPGATMLEPWRKDSSPGFERRYATLQSMRRRAIVHVKPQVDGGYLVDLAVYKELEDVSQPEFSTVNVEVAASRRDAAAAGQRSCRAGPRRAAGFPWAGTPCWNNACWRNCADAWAWRAK